MRIAERGERERAAWALAAAYASTSPVRTATSSGGWANCRRPVSARSAASDRHGATGGRASSARSRRGWVGETDEQLSLGLDFRRRRQRAALMGRPRAPACETTTRGAINDVEALEHQNQQLKVTVRRLVEENKRYRVNKIRLEGELLRADAKVEILISELEQAPGKRDQRLLNAARGEVEKCAVVRSLAKEKGHLQKMLARQERELDAIKQTKEWSAVVEMTAATEEYVLEIRRLQRLLAQHQQGTSAKSPAAGVGGREDGAAREAYQYVPNQCDRTHRSSSGVDDTVWIHRPEPYNGSMFIPSPVDGVQDNQRLLDVETTFTSGGAGVYNTVHEPISASAVPANELHEVPREDNDTALHEWGVPGFRRRPTSPKRRCSPPRRARMATRAGREAFGDRINKKLSAEPRDSPQTTQVARGELGRQRRGGSQSQVWARAAEARTSARGADARRSAVGIKSRPLSAPRTRREVKMTTSGDARQAGSLSPFDKGRRQVASTDRGAAAGSVGGGSAACARQKSRPRISSSSSRALADHSIPSWQTEEKGRPKARARSASPRPSSSRNGTGTGDAFRAQGEGTTRTASASFVKHHMDGCENCGDGGSDAGISGVDVAPRSSKGVGNELESPSLRNEDGTSDVPYDDEKGRLSSSIPSWESLAAEPAAAEHSSTAVAKECEEGTAAAATGKEGRTDQTTDCGSALGSPGSGDVDNVIKDKEGRVAQGDGLDRNLTESAPSSWGSSEAVGEPQKNEAGEGNSEEGSVGPVSSTTSTGVDTRENPKVDVMAGEKSTTTSKGHIKGDDGGEQQGTVAEITNGLPSGSSTRYSSNSSQNDGDNSRSSFLPERGDDNTITRSVSSHAVTEKGHQKVDAELFDVESDGDGVGDDPLIGESRATPSEYGDDFDDFEDEEG